MRARSVTGWRRSSSSRHEPARAPSGAGLPGRALPGRGSLGRPISRPVPQRRAARGPDAALPDLVAHAPLPRNRRRCLRRVAAGGRRLARLGLGPGDVVAFQLPNWVEAAITFYACAMLGVTLVPIVHFYGPKEVGFILRQSRARALIMVARIGQRDYLADLGTVRDGLPDLEHVIVVGGTEADGRAGGDLSFEDLRRAEKIDGPVAVDPDGPALIAYTSGTTADPEGRGAHAPHARLRGTPAVGPPGAARTARTSSARRSGTPSGCWAGCCARSWAGVRST